MVEEGWLHKMITVKDFYDRWEEVESRLNEMTLCTVLSLKRLAEENLKGLYQMKSELDELNPPPSKQVRGIRTEVLGISTFEQMEEFVKNYHPISQNYLNRMNVC